MQHEVGLRWSRSSVLILLIMLSQMHEAFAQSETIRGSVTDETGAPLPGATVEVKGTQVGTTTDADGRFQLNSASPVTLVVSFIGFEEQQVNATGATEINVVLKESSQQLNEVVVGYGTQKKVNLTGSVSVVEGESLTRRQVGSTSLALQGIAPGVTITQQSGYWYPKLNLLPMPQAERDINPKLSRIRIGNNRLVLLDARVCNRGTGILLNHL